jgi:hypothetical protein
VQIGNIDMRVPDAPYNIAALRNCLRPSITAMRCFTLLWSCSIRLFRYFEERSFVSVGNKPSAFRSRTAR